jgi:hypothetical protein
VYQVSVMFIVEHRPAIATGRAAGGCRVSRQGVESLDTWRDLGAEAFRLLATALRRVRRHADRVRKVPAPARKAQDSTSPSLD